MLINVTDLLGLSRSLFDEFNYQKSLGRKNCNINVRIDCVLKALQRCIGTSVVGKPNDKIIEVDL